MTIRRELREFLIEMVMWVGSFFPIPTLVDGESSYNGDYELKPAYTN